MRKTYRGTFLLLLTACVLCISVAPGCGPGPTESDLAGHEWLLIGWYEGVTCALPAVEGTEVTLQFFQDEGIVRGWTGCNTYGGAYEIDGHDLAIGELEVTEEACPDETLDGQQEMYLATLQQANSLSMEDDGRLRIESGNRGLVFVPRDR